MDIILRGGSTADMLLITELAKKLRIEVETLPAPKKIPEGCISVDEFFDKVDAGIKKAYADARSAGIPIGRG